jgi:hypothetical protein
LRIFHHLSTVTRQRGIDSKAPGHLFAILQDAPRPLGIVPEAFWSCLFIKYSRVLLRQNWLHARICQGIQTSVSNPSPGAFVFTYGFNIP